MRKNTLYFQSSFNRKNLIYQVENIGRYDTLASFIAKIIKKHFCKKSGIVYCKTIKECVRIHLELSRKGIKALPYYSQLKLKMREEN